jgi:hypothetical protein
MDMLFTNVPLQQGQTNSYVSPLKHGTSPSASEAQNAMAMEKTSMLPDDEEAVSERLRRAEEERREKRKRQKAQDCQACKKRQSETAARQQDDSSGEQGSHDEGQNGDGRATPCHSGAPEKPSATSRDVIGQDIVIHYEVCPECGRPYIPVGSAAQATRAASRTEKLGARYSAGLDLLPQGLNVNDEA